MPNPILNDKQLRGGARRLGRADAAEPGRGRVGAARARRAPRPIDDGPVTPWRPGMMTVRGSITATAVLFVLLLASATVGWMATDTAETVNGELQVTFPPLAFVGVIVGFVAVIVCYFKPRLAKILGPIYALAQGFFVGAISKVFETQWNGIVLQAAGATLAVFAVMLVLYHTKIIKVTDRFRQDRHLRHARRDGALPGVVRDQPVRRRDRRSSTTPRCSASRSASSSACWRR